MWQKCNVRMQGKPLPLSPTGVDCAVILIEVESRGLAWQEVAQCGYEAAAQYQEMVWPASCRLSILTDRRRISLADNIFVRLS